MIWECFEPDTALVQVECSMDINRDINFETLIANMVL